MMDAAYFTGRKELLEFFNDLLSLNLSKIEQTASGAVACQLAELIFPGSVPMSKVNWGAKSDYEFVQNYKLLQAAFTKNRVQRHVDVDKLIRGKYQDNLEFCQWLKAFYDQSGVYRENYDPVAVRERGKGGKRYNEQMGKVGGGGTTTRPAPTGRPAAAGATNKPAVAAKQPVADRKSRPLRERAVPAGDGSTKNQNLREPPTDLESNLVDAVVADAELMKKNADLTSKVEELDQTNADLTSKVDELDQVNADLTFKVDELEQAVLDIEKERDFYFEKLRHVEVMLQVHQEKGAESDPDHLVDKIFKVLYATAEDNLAVNEDGEVVEAEEIHQSFAEAFADEV
jgi:RP/EB family microtubule-associated protein